MPAPRHSSRFFAELLSPSFPAPSAPSLTKSSRPRVPPSSATFDPEDPGRRCPRRPVPCPARLQPLPRRALHRARARHRTPSLTAATSSPGPHPRWPNTPTPPAGQIWPKCEDSFDYACSPSSWTRSSSERDFRFKYK